MRAVLLLMFLWMPLRQQSSLEVVVACRTPEIFSDYGNANFRQEIRGHRNGVSVRIESRTLDFRNLNHALNGPGAECVAQDPSVRSVGAQLRQDANSIGDYLRGISRFLKNVIAYDESDLDQEPAAVLLNRRAHCVGFSNLAQALLACAGIGSRQVNGFYLRENNGLIEPVPHRWLEIFLPGDRRVFYDPQYQDFSSRYLLTGPGVVFSRIERFQGVVIKKRKKILDE
jgi:transglutaminase-like putative cysteine protease